MAELLLGVAFVVALAVMYYCPVRRWLGHSGTQTARTGRRTRFFDPSRVL